MNTARENRSLTPCRRNSKWSRRRGRQKASSGSKNGRFSVVIMDIRMPEMDGIRALEAIRKVDREISIVMLTGYGTLQTAQQSMMHGANQYLRKPPDISELMESVRKQASAAIFVAIRPISRGKWNRSTPRCNAR